VYRRPVESSLIKSVGYDLPSSVLEVELANGKGVYEYHDVPLSVYSRLMAADSPGGYFNEHIRDLYVSEKIG
jgi:lysyl-tRNA synthetase class 2